MKSAKELIEEKMQQNLNEGSSFRSIHSLAQSRLLQAAEALKSMEGLLYYRLYGEGSRDDDGKPMLDGSDKSRATKLYDNVRKAIQELERGTDLRKWGAEISWADKKLSYM